MQTVVDYIFEQLEENSLFFRGTDNELNISISASDYLDLKRLAKAIFEKQIIEAFDEGQEYEYQYHINNAPKFYSETYFAETYGSKGSDETNGNNVEEVPNVSNATEINWGGVVQHIPNICNCHQSNCHLINGKYICASCNKTLNVETQPIAPTQIEISEIEEYTSCPICNGTSINGFCSTPNCAYSLYEPNKDDLEMTPISSQTEISDEEIEKEANNLFAGDLMWSERIAFKVAIKWYREQLKKKQ